MFSKQTLLKNDVISWEKKSEEFLLKAADEDYIYNHSRLGHSPEKDKVRHYLIVNDLATNEYNGVLSYVWDKLNTIEEFETYSVEEQQEIINKELDHTWETIEW